jgi:hypothetical protein
MPKPTCGIQKSRPSAPGVISRVAVSLIICTAVRSSRLRTTGISATGQVVSRSASLAAGGSRRAEGWHGSYNDDIRLDPAVRCNLLYVACDGGLLVEVDVKSGEMRREWPLAGVPDTTFFNLKSGLVHVANENPGLV